MRKNRLMLLVLAALTMCTFAMAQKVQPSQQPLSATELDKLAASPSLEQALLRTAAEKLRQERSPGATVELQITVKVTAKPLGCYETCVYSGNKVIACTNKCFGSQQN